VKRVLSWLEEEKIAITVFLLGIGIILSSPPRAFIFSGMLIYAAILIVVLHLLHRLYLKFRK
jgi:hypothetical protein